MCVTVRKCKGCFVGGVEREFVESLDTCAAPKNPPPALTLHDWSGQTLTHVFAERWLYPEEGSVVLGVFQCRGHTESLVQTNQAKLEN